MTTQFSTFDEFTSSDYYYKNKMNLLEDDEDVIFSKDFIGNLIETNVITPKVGLELYISENLFNFDENILKWFISTYDLDINELYDFPTDANLPTTLLNCVCEFRYFDAIGMVLNIGANPNTKCSINYTPLQSLLSGHCPDDIGQNPKGIKNSLELLVEKGSELVLFQWQYDEFFLPYLESEESDYFEKLQINIIEDQNE